jgi:ribosomal subunit interface protein
MHITYTGRHVDLAPGQVKKIEEQFGTVAKLLDGKAKNGVGEAEAHVRISQEGRMLHAEVNINFHHHALVGHGASEDAEIAIHGAVQKLESQAIKVTKKWADAKRASKPSSANAAD